MKQIEFKTINGEFIIIELDENLINNISRIERLNNSGKINFLVEHVGFIENITEEQAKEVVDYCITGLGYNDYNGSICFGLRLTAIESLQSLLEANGVMFENPYRDVGCIPSAEQKLYRDFKDKIWNKQQTYLFKKI